MILANDNEVIRKYTPKLPVKVLLGDKKYTVANIMVDTDSGKYHLLDKRNIWLFTLPDAKHLDNLFGGYLVGCNSKFVISDKTIHFIRLENVR